MAKHFHYSHAPHSSVNGIYKRGQLCGMPNGVADMTGSCTQNLSMIREPSVHIWNCNQVGIAPWSRLKTYMDMRTLRG